VHETADNSLFRKQNHRWLRPKTHLIITLRQLQPIED